MISPGCRARFCKEMRWGRLFRRTGALLSCLLAFLVAGQSQESATESPDYDDLDVFFTAPAASAEGSGSSGYGYGSGLGCEGGFGENPLTPIGMYIACSLDPVSSYDMLTTASLVPQALQKG